MINSEPVPIPGADPRESQVEQIVRSGAGGALTLAGIATAIVVLIWFLFYLLVFVPRAPAP
ncbi:MAG: hypothetical protein JOZ05_11210 [Acetobacteraceae bacterium]|nr:hypothetical protein [Acetobacteraceae bacterium]